MNALQSELKPYLASVAGELNTIQTGEDIPYFYQPIRYVLALPAKRIRPLLLQLVAHTLGVAPEQSRYAAAAVELLHNFTLVHDDVMDQDDLRRGAPTVHKKWDVATAILAGDGLMGMAFQKLLASPRGDLVEMARRFAATMVVVCEGQGKDKMFEELDRVSEQEYLDMIGRKTAALLRLSCELGALLAEADQTAVKKAGDLGYALGMGFQIQDDLLDILADQRELGKDIGSDLERHKQTILAIKLAERMPEENVFALSLDDFRARLQETGVLQEVRAMSERYFETAFDNLSRLPQGQPRVILEHLAGYIRKRRW